ncbi:MAG TPA: hypothetical protein PLC61_07060 [Chitinophagales bacterium]|nr:hypothetical protein [Chitinophagales bacterium]
MKIKQNNLIIYFLCWYLLIGIFYFILGCYLQDVERDTRAFVAMYACYYISMLLPAYLFFQITSFVFKRSIVFIAKKRLVKPSHVRDFAFAVSILIAIFGYSHFIYLHFFL